MLSNNHGSSLLLDTFFKMELDVKIDPMQVPPKDILRQKSHDQMQY